MDTHPHHVEITGAERKDLAEILRVQHAAFGRVARDLAIDPGMLPPLRETLADLEALLDAGMRFLLARADGRVIGSVRGERRDDGAVEVGRLVVDDGFERRGVASALMRSLEASYAPGTRFELFTGEQAVAARALYDKLGYHVFRREIHGGVPLVWLEKGLAPAGGEDR